MDADNSNKVVDCLRGIDQSLSQIAKALEGLDAKLDRLTGRNDYEKSFLRTLDIGREG